MLFLINQTMVDLEIGTSALIATLGYGVVFFGLILLMAVIAIVGKIMMGSKKEPTAVPAVAAPVSASAPGTAGELKLHDVSAKDAALIMAIVAYKSGKPLNCLRFKSIKEVKGE